MNYQICNGGLYQYFDNGYDKERAPYGADDVRQLDKGAQVAMLRELVAFGKAVFPERELDNERLSRIAADFDRSFYEEPADTWYDDEDDDEDFLCGPGDFDSRYYEVNGYLEVLIEAYAQYLVKKFEAA